LAAESGKMRLLEVGCGAGHRLGWLQHNLGLECHGIDPSAIAVAEAVQQGVSAQTGTADSLPFADKAFDVVIFGFCLYLCDRDDLFRIAAEADRVLKNPGWLLIKDFFSATPVARPYHHKAGVQSYKMDYTTLFSWNPDYSVYSHRVAHHLGDVFTDDHQEWVATSVLRKCQQI
jgi:ubiquinone/menaquinone biosynthesis C-methylase UbiE